jgi:hypothetical protein
MSKKDARKAKSLLKCDSVAVHVEPGSAWLFDARQ